MVSQNGPVEKVYILFVKRFVLCLPVDVLLHEQVEAIVKVAPHVRVEMDPADALWVGGSSHSVQFGQKTAPAIHHHISEIFLSLN